MENKKSADKTYKIFVGITAAATIGAYCIWQNMSVSLSKITYISGKVPKSFDGFKIIHISDLHNKKFIGGQNYLINKIIKASPDAIFITGDIISSYDKNIKTAIEYAKGFNSIAPTYYVTGNHETRLSAQNFDYLINALEEAGVYVLNDKALKLTKNNDSIFIAGLEDGLDLKGPASTQTPLYPIKLGPGQRDHPGPIHYPNFSRCGGCDPESP